MPKLKERYTVNASQLEGLGSSISFLKRKLLRIPNGLALVSVTSVDKLVQSFEQWFGRTRFQMVPCDNSIQLEDLSQPLSGEDSFHYRSVVGMCLYLAPDRP